MGWMSGSEGGWVEWGWDAYGHPPTLIWLGGAGDEGDVNMGRWGGVGVDVNMRG